MSIAAQIIFYAILSVCLALNIFGLPGNWIMIGAIFLWDLFASILPETGWLYWLAVLALAVGGEIAQFVLQTKKSREGGSSKAGIWGGLIGAFVLGILMAPLFFGLGALIGAFGGAWLGCLCVELIIKRNFRDALRSARGALVGNFLGVAVKLGAGIAIIAVSAGAIR